MPSAMAPAPTAEAFFPSARPPSLMVYELAPTDVPPPPAIAFGPNAKLSVLAWLFAPIAMPDPIAYAESPIAIPPILVGAFVSTSTNESTPIATPSEMLEAAPLPRIAVSAAIAAPAPARLMPPTATCARMALEIAVLARLLLLRPVASSETATHDPVDSFQTDLYDLFMLYTFYKKIENRLAARQNRSPPLFRMTNACVASA
ncbi:hypothetical protein AWB64_06064 [Caballeronia sordidicola]|uniref:Uncharacterized protein n=1 Tax=Caballeronia sordidicola TaxID=196367 RepID=A0A158IF85_CABSO|nr:hypothetical protein AWB64_06064 [Caballeronia sordidicola]